MSIIYKFCYTLGKIIYGSENTRHRHKEKQQSQLLNDIMMFLVDILSSLNVDMSVTLLEQINCALGMV